MGHFSQAALQSAPQDWNLNGGCVQRWACLVCVLQAGDCMKTPAKQTVPEEPEVKRRAGNTVFDVESGLEYLPIRDEAAETSEADTVEQHDKGHGDADAGNHFWK